MISKRSKHILGVLLAQAGCLAVGLWMQFQFVRSSASDAAVKAAWKQLELTADRSLAAFKDHDVKNIHSDSEKYKTLTLCIKAACSQQAGVMILDRQWRVMIPTIGNDDPANTINTITPGDKVEWIPNIDKKSEQEYSLLGVLELSDGPHIAVVREWGKIGYLVAHRSQNEVKQTAAALLDSHLAITGLTLIWTVALLSVSAYMVLARFHDQMEQERSHSNAEDLKQRQKLIRTRDAVIFGLAKLADSRDPETGDHLERISVYATTLASSLRKHPKYKDLVTPGFIRLIGISSALHDIGKVGIEDSILLKPSKLTPEERERMQYHTTIGGECLREIEYRLGSSNFLQMAREIAFSHHENWDGSGYLAGMKGQEIPLCARIVSIVDVYDALSSRRVYKEPFPHDKCVAIIKESAGKQFDPDIVDVWLAMESRFGDIAAQYTNDTQLATQSVTLPGTTSMNIDMDEKEEATTKDVLTAMKDSR